MARGWNIFLVSALLGLAGCAQRPPQPAMVAATAGSDFGYADTRVAADRYDVSYQTPVLRIPVEEKARQAELGRQAQRAYDLALWRAAQIALAQGYSRLLVVDQRREVEIRVSKEGEPVAPGVYGSGGMLYPLWIYNPDVPYYGVPGAGPYWIYDDPFAVQVRHSADARITARLTVAFTHSAGPGSLDAAATEARLAKELASATY
jgi:hypothetical protein